MEITVNGGTANQRKYAHSMVEFCLKKLLPRHKKISVEVNFRRMTRDHCLGYCCHLEGKEFEIDLKRTMTMREMLTTLAHELVHVKQYVRGEMPETISEGEYWDRPHEIEAHGRETGLFIRWAEQAGVAGKKWTQRS